MYEFIEGPIAPGRLNIAFRCSDLGISYFCVKALEVYEGGAIIKKESFALQIKIAAILKR